MKEIVLSNGMITLVDDVDYYEIGYYLWFPTKNRESYYAVRSKGSSNTKIALHVEIAIRMKLDTINFQVDHKDRDTLNNQRNNLRQATHSQNIVNSKLRSDNTSGHKGISYNKKRGKYSACI